MSTMDCTLISPDMIVNYSNCPYIYHIHHVLYISIDRILYIFPLCIVASRDVNQSNSTRQCKPESLSQHLHAGIVGELEEVEAVGRHFFRMQVHCMHYNQCPLTMCWPLGVYWECTPPLRLWTWSGRWHRLDWQTHPGGHGNWKRQ